MMDFFKGLVAWNHFICVANMCLIFFYYKVDVFLDRKFRIATWIVFNGVQSPLIQGCKLKPCAI
jgi:hypothetical protein